MADVISMANNVPMRKKYLVRLTGRILMAAVAVLLYFLWPESYSALEPDGFWKKGSPLHLAWLIWLVDMVLQLIPVRNYVALGTQKQFRAFHVPALRPAPRQELRAFVRRSDLAALKVFLLWAAVTVAVGLLYRCRILSRGLVFLFAMAFYVSDLICVLFWCPFRVLIMKNRCCTTCRIFNWDHLMMFSVFAFVSGFFAKSLFWASVLVFVVWEIRFHRHPERFWEKTNVALRCANCTDKLCYRHSRTKKG